MWVAHLPGAVGHIHAFGTGPLLLATAGLLLLCLLRSPLRWSGAVLAVGAALWVLAWPRPDLIVAGDGQAAAMRGRDGKLALLHNSRDTFAIKEWLMADGDGRDPKDERLRDGVACDPAGCIGKLADGRLVSFALPAEAFAEDCARAAVVVSAHQAPGDCHALLIDRPVWREQGAVALRWTGDRFDLSAARPPGYERPWTRGPRDGKYGSDRRDRPRPMQRRGRRIWRRGTSGCHERAFLATRIANKFRLREVFCGRLPAGGDKMFDLEQFTADCRAALAADPSHKLVREVVARAVSDPNAVLKGIGEPKRAEVQKLYHAPDLTILNVIWGPMMTIMPHNHQMWAVIGIYSGREDNVFWRRLPDGSGKVEAAGARALRRWRCRTSRP